jgi:hypothetical protein
MNDIYEQYSRQQSEAYRTLKWSSGRRKSIMANDDTIKTEKELPSGLTWLQAFDLAGEATVLPLLWVSGRVAIDDKLPPADRYRLADAIIKQQTSTKAKEEITMTSTNEAATMLADAEQRQFLLAAAKHRRQLQKNDMESIFDIAARLRVQVADARAANAAQRRPKATFDAAGHRPGWRLTDDAWRHDRRRKQSTTHEFDPAGCEANTYVTTEEDDEEDGEKKRQNWRSDQRLLQTVPRRIV